MEVEALQARQAAEPAPRKGRDDRGACYNLLQMNFGKGVR